jgi:hypothetical protein
MGYSVFIARNSHRRSSQRKGGEKCGLDSGPGEVVALTGPHLAGSAAAVAPGRAVFATL